MNNGSNNAFGPRWRSLVTDMFQRPSETLMKYVSWILALVTHLRKENVYLIPDNKLMVMYRRKYCDVVKYTGKGGEVKYYYKVMSNNLKLFPVGFTSLE